MTERELWRFMAKVMPEPMSGCWLWIGAVNNGYYGNFHRRRLDGTSSTCGAHRVSYEHFVGLIPGGLTIDHLCRVRLCVNPGHLEPVTNQENILRGEGLVARQARQTECIYGHEFTPENTLIRPDGSRNCRACARARWHSRKGEVEYHETVNGLAVLRR